MTEPEWLECTDPTPMLGFLRGKASNRKLRLFALAAWRLSYGKYLPANTAEEPADLGPYTIVVAERYADGHATQEEIEAAEQNAREYGYQFLDEIFGFTEPYSAYMALAGFFGHSAFDPARRALFISDPTELRPTHANLLRDLFGNPFRPASLNLAWITPTVTTLATAAYEERILPSGELEAARLAVLADALEEAGCDNPDILNHLRSPGPHVRGCFVVDLLTGRG
jgi:hypothetical protein